MAVTSLYREPEAREQPRPAALEFVDVFKIYRSGAAETVALRGLDLASSAASWSRSFGPSGSGKSTLLRARSRARPALGRRRARVRTPAGPARRATSSPRYRAHDVAIVFQSGTSGPSSRRARTSRSRCGSPARRPTRGDAALGAFGLGRRVAGRAGALSGGEQQRVAIAAAAARERRSCSPTSRPAELDDANEQLVLDALHRLRDEHGATVVLVTHSPRVADACRPGRRDPRRAGRTRRAPPAVPRSSGRRPIAAPGRVRALDGVDLDVASRRELALSAAPAPARRRCCTCSAASSRRPRASLGGSARALDPAARGASVDGRVRLPGREPAPVLHRARERRASPQRAAARTPDELLALVGLAASATTCRRSSRAARRSASRSRERSPEPDAAALRRADRPPRLRHRRPRARPDRRAARAARLRPRRSRPTTPRRRAARARSSSCTTAASSRSALRCRLRRSSSSCARPMRTLSARRVLAAAVALLGAMLLFIGNSLRTMTASAVRTVPLDWQGPVGSCGAARQRRRDASPSRRGVAAAVPVATASFAGASTPRPPDDPRRRRRASPFRPTTPSRFHTLRMLRRRADRRRSCSTSSSPRPCRRARGHSLCAGARARSRIR